MLLDRSQFVRLASTGIAATALFGSGALALADEAQADSADADASEAGAVTNLSDPDYDFQAEYFYSDYNARSNAEGAPEGIDIFDDKDIVFKSLYYDELNYLLNQEGNYLILFGGSWCPNTRAEIAKVNEFAKAHGIDTVYNFDLRFDGSTRPTHVRETALTPEYGGENVVAADWNYLYGELVERFLYNLNDWVEYKADTDSALTWYDGEYEGSTVPKLQVPFLFLYNKDNTTRYVPVYDENGKQTGVEVADEELDFSPEAAEDDAEATDGTTRVHKGTYPIVYGFEEMVVRDADGIYVPQYDSDYKEIGREYITDDFYSRLEGVFNFIDEQGITVDTYTDQQYLYDAFAAGNGRGHSDKLFDVFEEGEQINIEPITLRQAEWLFQQEGSAVVVFAGAWCANSQASLGPINDYAVADGTKVYLLDFRLDGKYPIDFWGYGRDRQFFIRSTYQEASKETEQNHTQGPQGASGQDVSIAESGEVASTFEGQPNPFAYLYTDFINTYLTNVESVTDPSSSGYYITSTDADGNEAKALKLQQPYLLAYNKDAVDEDGFVAPVLAWYEEMLEITEASLERGSYIYQTDNYASYTSGIEQVLQAYDDSLGRAYTPYTGEPRHELVEPAEAEEGEDAEGKA